MTIENGAAAANDTLLCDEQTDGQGPEEVEVTYDGKTYLLPPELKNALLRQADYTRKTQEVAQGRKALEAAHAEHHQSVAGSRAHIQDAARIVALNDQLAQFAQVDWRALQAQDPARAQALYQEFQQLKTLRDHAARAWRQKDQDQALDSQRATARRAQALNAQMPRLIADWSPELDSKLAVYGTEQGLSRDEMAQAALQNPHFLRLLHKGYLFDEAEKLKQTKQNFDAAQAARPVTRVGGGGGTAGRRRAGAIEALYEGRWLNNALGTLFGAALDDICNADPVPGEQSQLKVHLPQGWRGGFNI